METKIAALGRADMPEVAEYASDVVEMAGGWADMAEAAGDMPDLCTALDGLMHAAARVRSLAQVMS